jgi:cytochrome oxidase Cu insertion factor (SCO1/SenC/PrrC family)
VSQNGAIALGAILLIAGISLAGAYVAYYVAHEGGVWATTNNGEFVQPAVTLADLDVVDEQGERVSAGANWWLWVLVSQRCDGQCEAAVHQLRQLHVLLNKDASRVRRALVTGRGLARPGVLQDYPNMLHLQAVIDGLVEGIYIVDPIGNLVLFYPYTVAGKPVLDDLKRLLRISQIG